MSNKIISIDTLKYYNEKIANYVDEKVSDSVNNLELDELNAILVDTDTVADDPIVSDYVTENELEAALTDKQNKLVSGTNIKTINGTSLLGSGDITISGGGDYLPSAGGTINGDLVVMGTIASPTLIMATGGVEGYLRSSDYIIGLDSVDGDIVWGKEAGPDEYYITAKGDGTKFLSDDGTYKTISGGSGAGVYITPFTVDEFCTTSIELTEEQRNDLRDAASQKKIIGIRSGHNDTSGYIIASYIYDYTSEELWTVKLSFVWNSAYYVRYFYSYDEINGLQRLSITPFTFISFFVDVKNGVADVYDDINYTDNCVFWVNGECTELCINLEASEIGKTVRFFTGESCTLEFIRPVYWANGEVPNIEPYTHYELSLVVNMEGVANAVLTPFKPVE